MSESRLSVRSVILLTWFAELGGIVDPLTSGTRVTLVRVSQLI